MKKNLDLLDCQIYTFSKEILSRKVLKVEAKTIRDRMITILPGHENDKLLLFPGKMVVHGRDMLRTYCHGTGFLEIKNDQVIIFSALIFNQEDYDSYKKILDELGDVGADLIDIWQMKES